MVRNYVRKTQRRSYAAETFNEAISKIRSGELTTKRSIMYDIPRETLRDHLKGRRARLGPLLEVEGGQLHCRLVRKMNWPLL